MTKYLATQHAASPSVVIFRGYLLDLTQLEADVLAGLDAIEPTIKTRATPCSRWGQVRAGEDALRDSVTKLASM